MVALSKALTSVGMENVVYLMTCAQQLLGATAPCLSGVAMEAVHHLGSCAQTAQPWHALMGLSSAKMAAAHLTGPNARPRCCARSVLPSGVLMEAVNFLHLNAVHHWSAHLEIRSCVQMAAAWALSTSVPHTHHALPTMCYAPTEHVPQQQMTAI